MPDLRLTALELRALYSAAQYYNECAEIGGDRDPSPRNEAALHRAIRKMITLFSEVTA